MLFDLDRTLVDLQSFTDYDAAWRDLRGFATSANVALPQTDWDAATVACMSTLVELTDPAVWSKASALVAGYERAAIPQSRAMPGLHAAMDAVDPRRIAVVTLLPVDVAAQALAHHGVAVEVIIGRDWRIAPKPSGAGLLVACERLGCAPADAVMIGDSTWDHAAAVDAGCAFVGVPVTADAFPQGTAVAPDLLAALTHAGVLSR